MSNRQGDAVYFLVLAAAVGAAWWATSRPGEPTSSQELPDFSLPGLRLDVPLELPGFDVEFRRRASPSLRLGHDTEGVIREVRAALLASASPDEEALAQSSPEVGRRFAAAYD